MLFDWQDTYIILNLHSIHMDPEYWNEPEVFRPDRHISPEGQIVISDRLLPFGAGFSTPYIKLCQRDSIVMSLFFLSGKRSCLGEQLARASYFLFTASLIKAFTFSPVTAGVLPSLVPREGFTLAHQPFCALLISRDRF